MHLKNVTNLELPFPSDITFLRPDTSISGGLWVVLGSYGTRLKHIYAPVSDELVHYIETYSGIEYLRLYGTAYDSLAHRFHDSRKRAFSKLLEQRVLLVETLAWRASGSVTIYIALEICELRK